MSLFVGNLAFVDNLEYMSFDLRKENEKNVPRGNVTPQFRRKN